MEVLLVAAKKTITRYAKLNLIGGQAKPGPALASVGINMALFTKQFNDATKDQNGKVVAVWITAYSDKSFDYVIKTTPASILIKEAAKVQKGAKNPKTDHVASITHDQALKIARAKMKDLNTTDEEAAVRMIAGTARNMGITVEGLDQKNDKKPAGEAPKVEPVKAEAGKEGK